MAVGVVVQIPYQPDPNLRGYVGGFSLGHHVYLTPHFNGVFFGKVRRPRKGIIESCKFRYELMLRRCVDLSPISLCCFLVWQAAPRHRCALAVCGRPYFHTYFVYTRFPNEPPPPRSKNGPLINIRSPESICERC